MSCEKKCIDELFDKKGNCVNSKQSYFDDEGDLIEYDLIDDHYNDYPVCSDIVRMYYASEYAEETHGNYTAYTLFRRVYGLKDRR